MLQRSKAANSLLFAARAARVVLASSDSLAAAHRPSSAPCTHEADRNAMNNHPAASVHAAMCSEASVATQTPACRTETIDTASRVGRRFDTMAGNKQRWATTSPLTAAWHASHAAIVGAPHHHQQAQTSPTRHASGLHTSAAAQTVAERVESAHDVDENPPQPATDHSERNSSNVMDRPFQDIQEIAAVYDDMRDALRQSSSEDENLEFRNTMQPEYLETEGGRLAYHAVQPTASAMQQKSPGVIFCGGLLSNMNGKKATLLEVHARQRGHPFVRFDYRGHGSSDGEFEDTVFGDWYEDTLAIIDSVAQPGCQHVLVGSSIGAWIALKAAAARRESIQGVVLLAPAVDITELWWENMSAQQRADAKETGYVPLQNSTPAGARVRVEFFDEASDHCILDVAQRDQQVRCPVRIFHGTEDDVVPPFIAGEVASWLESKDVEVSLVKDGDHRLSRPEDLHSMMLAVDELLTYKTK